MLIDSHIHLDDERFDADREAVVKRANDSGVVGMIVPAVTASSWHKTKICTEKYQNIFAAYGLHPYFIDHHEWTDLDQLSTWIQNENPIAVGECGLDYFLAELDRAKQKTFFEQQLTIAKEFDLPIIVHARSAVEDVINTIKKSGHRKGMIHSYNGSLQQAERLIALGYLLSFGGAVTYPRAKKLRSLISELPLESLLIETDAPDQPDSVHYGQRNEPAFISTVFSTFVELRSENEETIRRQLYNNTRELFQLTDRGLQPFSGT